MIRPLARAALHFAVVAAALAVAADLHAQAEAYSQTGRLVLLPTPGLEPLARNVARAYERRTGREVELGGAPPVIPEAVPTGHLALVESEDGALTLYLGAEGGHTVSAQVGERADARTLALALEELEDDARRSAMMPPAPPPPSPGGYVYLDYEQAPRRRQLATPMVYLRLLVGFSPVRRNVLIGPGAGFGLCVSVHCVAIEADLPLLREELETQPGVRVAYRAVNTSVRVQLRPLVIGPHSLGITLGFLTRIGNAQVVGDDASFESISNLGLRGTLEYAYRVSGPFEFVVEAGVDWAVTHSRMQILYDGQRHYLEDEWTPWVVTSFRVRPDLRRASQ